MMQKNERAIVVGGSLAGLWTARVLADHFQSVTVLERDVLPDGAASRAGVPQDKHVHVLLRRGATIMGRLFLGIEKELLAAGALRVDLTQDGRARIRGRWTQRFPSDQVTYACSRILLESILRRRVAALPNVELRGGGTVQGLTAEAGRVTGVQVQWKNGQPDSVESADFVVDASGRTSKAPEWLTALGFARPDETVIDAKLGYAGRRYRIPNDPNRNWSTMLIGQEPPDKSRAGLIYSEEENVWMVMVAGIMGDYPPTDEEGFNAFAATIDPDFYAAIQQAEPISNIIGYRRTENRFRHYEKLARWPDRFVVLGDAVCGFNPVYGQGMTVSAMAAENLGQRLDNAGGKLDGVAQHFQQGYPKIVEPAWLLATSADLEWIGRTGPASLADRISGWYIPKVLDAIPADRIVHEAFLEVQNLMAPPTALFAPQVFVRVLRHWLGSPKKAAAA
jgi:2-polyprenyl-6-methoxyphenol hydroxylase-like FAD-dependent oxidoreductase